MRWLAGLSVVLLAHMAWAAEPEMQLDYVVVTAPKNVANRLQAPGLKSTGNLVAGVMPQSAATHFLESIRPDKAVTFVAASQMPARTKVVHSVETGRVYASEPLALVFPVHLAVEISVRSSEAKQVEVEMRTCVKSINNRRGITTSAGFIPGVDQQRSMSRLVASIGSTMVFSVSDESNCYITAVTPKRVIPATTASERKAASKLVAMYQAACARGDRDQARELARLAVDLDPDCFLPRVESPPASNPLDLLPSIKPGEETPCSGEPNEVEIRKALPRFKNVPMDGVEFECEKLIDRIDPPRFFPLAGIAQLHHCHWKCTLRWTDPDGQARVEVVYVDKDRLHRYEPQPTSPASNVAATRY